MFFARGTWLAAVQDFFDGVPLAPLCDVHSRLNADTHQVVLVTKDGRNLVSSCSSPTMTSLQFPVHLTVVEVDPIPQLRPQLVREYCTGQAGCCPITASLLA